MLVSQIHYLKKCSYAIKFLFIYLLVFFWGSFDPQHKAFFKQINKNGGQILLRTEKMDYLENGVCRLYTSLWLLIVNVNVVVIKLFKYIWMKACFNDITT